MQGEHEWHKADAQKIGDRWFESPVQPVPGEDGRYSFCARLFYLSFAPYARRDGYREPYSKAAGFSNEGNEKASGATQAGNCSHVFPPHAAFCFGRTSAE